MKLDATKVRQHLEKRDELLGKARAIELANKESNPEELIKEARTFLEMQDEDDFLEELASKAGQMNTFINNAIKLNGLVESLEGKISQESLDSLKSVEAEMVVKLESYLGVKSEELQ